MRDPSTIVSLYTDRKKYWGPIHAAGSLVKQVYNGELSVVLPELESSQRAAIANLILTGLDQHAMRIASVMPNINCPPFKANNPGRARAITRKNTVEAWWYLNKIPRLTRRRARHLIGYGMSPVLIRPDPCGYPIWEMRDPLTTYPAPSDPDDLCPPDTIFCFKRTLRWLELHYPECAPRISRPPNASGDDMFEVIQYIDAEQMTLIALGQEDEHRNANNVTLSTTANRTGRPLVITPGRITLDRLQGQFDQMIGMYEAQATLWALHMEAVKRGIFGELYAVSADGTTPEVIPADPYTGDIGRVTGGTLVPVRTDPGFQQLQAMDRLEASQRSAGSVPAQFGGEGPSNVRTGRAQSMTQGAAIDYPIQEAQEILAASLQEENDAAIDITMTYWANTSRTFAVPGLRQPVTYTPADIFSETKTQFVQYPMTGVDANGYVIEGGQRIGMGTMSKQTFMENDPAVRDADAEMDRITLEAVRQASLSALQTQAADPAGPFTPRQLARLEELIYDKNMDYYKAMEKLDDEIKAEQAAAAQGQMDPTQMQPGLAMAGAPGTQAAGQAIGPASPSMSNLTGLLANLRLQQRTSPAEEASPVG